MGGARRAAWSEEWAMASVHGIVEQGAPNHTASQIQGGCTTL